ncbi:Abi family protein [Rhizobium paknamense]|uniref:Abortive infection bacteriophage resistance protein n=1 Tax=Rhizobium paknamense TaxID=1206817 RepID=A0ABU0IBW1_9HYPH|nr:Abi family protein [Rhizobium paknamense]MDQ0455123.1 abortive infection bacteriophage resistance protein [Rhizobium paknamense]
MSKIPFVKNSFSPAELLAKLECRGLLVEDRQFALSYLTFVGGYRLKGYYFHVLDGETKHFPAGYRFQHIADRYEFDRQLRALTFTVITRLETAVRTTMANHLSDTYGPHWFLKHELFRQTHDWSLGRLINQIEHEVDRAKATAFVSNYATKFSEPYLPPSWAVAECVSFAMWSKTYKSLRNETDKRAISVRFKVNQPDVFASWLHCLTIVRNTVAHHGRLLGHRFAAGPQNCKERNLLFDDPHSLYAAATVMNYMQTVTRLPNGWKADLQALFARFPQISPEEVGFSAGWQRNPGW